MIRPDYIFSLQNWTPRSVYKLSGIEEIMQKKVVFTLTSLVIYLLTIEKTRDFSGI